jgi:type I restriction enzyme S subunit
MQSEFERLTMGATIRTIGMPDVGSFVIPVPPVKEQRAIVSELTEARAQIDKLLANIERQLEKLREYRSAVIAAAVTGKIDVR